MAAVILLSTATTPRALADGPVGSDPAANFPAGPLPSACQSAPDGGACIAAGASYLDQARASLGQPPYALPSDFASLTGAEQALVLTNLDRILYGLAPIPGLTSQLDQDAAAGVASDSDPRPSQSGWRGYTANWAEGEANMPLAYLDWMYNDGPGSFNLDCPSPGAAGCWGHRHDVLWQFDGSGPLAMGAATGPDPGGHPSYALLLEQQLSGPAPAYVYTWSQAVAAGAGGSGASGGGPSGGSGSAGGPSAGSSAGGSPAASPSPPPGAAAARDLGVRIRRLWVAGHRVGVAIAGARTSAARCTLIGRTARGRRIRRSRRCAAVVRFVHLPGGDYRLRVSFAAGAISRRVRVP